MDKILWVRCLIFLLVSLLCCKNGSVFACHGMKFVYSVPSVLRFSAACKFDRHIFIITHYSVWIREEVNGCRLPCQLVLCLSLVHWMWLRPLSVIFLASSNNFYNTKTIECHLIDWFWFGCEISSSNTIARLSMHDKLLSYHMSYARIQNIYQRWNIYIIYIYTPSTTE